MSDHNLSCGIWGDLIVKHIGHVLFGSTVQLQMVWVWYSWSFSIERFKFPTVFGWNAITPGNTCCASYKHMT